MEDFLNSFPNPEDYLSAADQDGDNELLDEAIKGVQRYERASASLLQRTLVVGYARAARLIDLLEKKGIIGAAVGSRPRQVLKFKADRETEEVESANSSD